ncbi:MAG TPA: S8 family serine peptidase [Gaiellaceae bacterium]|nr:S8 family serine peptidase [Gaiellaceae bacterium]
MRWGVAVGTAVVGAALVASAPPDRSASARPSAEQLAAGYTTERALAAALRSAPAVVVRRLPGLHVVELRTPDPTHVAAALRRAPGIRFVQRPAARLSAAEPGLAVASFTPHALGEWQYRAAHEDAVPAAVLRVASSIRIAVIDTGADLTAPDLAAKNPETYNTRTGTGDVRDSNGHGTFVASIAAGSVTNNEGVAGAGGDAQLLVVKASTSGGSFTDMDEAAGIIYAVDHGAKIVNLSMGGTNTSATERRAIDYAVEHGVLIVAAVGNEYASGDPVEYPAALLQPTGSNGVGGVGLAVTASTASGVRASFANTGSWVSLAAPGEGVFGAVSRLASPLLYPRSALPGSQSGLYGYASGTSFAAPEVSGAAALVWAANPSLTAAQVAQILKETASGQGRWTPALGFGVIDVAAAVARAEAGDPGVLLSGNRVDSRERLTWGGDAARYTLSLSIDSGPAQPVLASTPQTSASVSIARGHVYAFTVAALDANGSTTSTSAPLTVAVAGVHSRR